MRIALRTQILLGSTAFLCADLRNGGSDSFDLHVMTDKCVQVIELSHKSGTDYARCSDAHFMTSGSFFTEGHG